MPSKNPIDNRGPGLFTAQRRYCRHQDIQKEAASTGAIRERLGTSGVESWQGNPPDSTHQAVPHLGGGFKHVFNMFSLLGDMIQP